MIKINILKKSILLLIICQLLCFPVYAADKAAITKYNSNIKPGQKLPDDVYECALKHLKGTGSELAAKIIWQACLRLNLK